MNAYKDRQAIITSLFDGAKGSIPILLERKKDHPLIETTPLSDEQEMKIKTVGSMAETFRSITRKNNPLILKSEGKESILEELEKRAQAGMLILINPHHLELKDNANQFIKNIRETSNAPWIEKSLADESQACVEVKMNANIPFSSFDLVVLPKYFEKYQDFFAFKDKLVFVDSTQSDITYNFPPPEEFNDRTNTHTIVKISHPNFAEVAENYLREKIKTEGCPYIFQHVAKGPRPNDEAYEKYWSKVTPDQYDKWLS